MSDFRVSQSFPCSAETLFDCWTDPHVFAQWFNAAPGLDAVVHELDARPGGRIRFDMQGPDGETYPQSGTFVELNRPHKIVQEEVVDGQVSQMMVTFLPDGDGCLMTVHQPQLPEEHHEMAMAGWGQIYAKLRVLLTA